MQPKRLALLCYLTLAGPRPPASHRRDTLLGVFWPGHDEEHARQSLRQALTALRSVDGSLVITRGDDEVALNPPRLACDVLAFEAAIELGRLETAVDLYAGPLLHGFFLDRCRGFERWVESERRRLSDLATDAAWRLAERDLTRDATLAVRRARWAAGLVPDDEGAIRRLIRLLDRAGERATALREYDAFALRLRQEHQADPAPETQRLIGEVRARRLEPAPVAVQGIHGGPGVTRPAPRRMGWKRLHRFGAITALIIGLVVTGWLTLRPLANEASAVNTRIAVFPFRVQADRQFAYLSEGVMDVLSEALDRAGDLRRVDPHALMSRLRRQGTVSVELSDAKQVAKAFSAGRFVLGTVVDVGTELRISGSLYGVTRGPEPVARASVQGREDRIAELLEALARDLIAQMPLGSGSRLEDASGVQAMSFPALKAYLVGEALLRRGRWDSAGVVLNEAIKQDSTFALAWYRLAYAGGFGGGGDPVRSIDQAMRHRDHLSPRDRLLVEADHAYLHGDSRTAERIALEAVGRYPDQVEAWNLLASIRQFFAWQQGRSWVEARATLDRALQIDPDYPEALWHAAWMDAFEGRYATAEILGQREPRGGGPGFLSAIGFGRGKPDAAQKALRELRTGDDRTAGLVAFLTAYATDSLREARRLYDELLADPDRSHSTRLNARLYSAHLEVARGRWDAARSEFARAKTDALTLAVAYLTWQSAFPFVNRLPSELRALRDSLSFWEPQPVSRFSPGIPGLWMPDMLLAMLKPYLLGILSARLGDQPNAVRYARVLETLREPADSIGLAADLALEIRALTALEAGRTLEALELLERTGLAVDSWVSWASPFHHRTMGRLLRAELLYRLGRYDEAFGWFSVVGWAYGPEFVHRGHALLRLGEIHERRGEREKAVHHYRRFVARWHDADPAYQHVVQEVRQRIARLQ